MAHSTTDWKTRDDGGVDAADFVVWRPSVGQTGAGLTDDGNGNGAIDFGEHDVWRANFGKTTGRSAVDMLSRWSASAELLSATAPERATTILVVITGVVLFALSAAQPMRFLRSRKR
jgi:hypothetical protein